MLSEKLKAQLILRETTVMFSLLRCVLAGLVLITLILHVTPAVAQTCPHDGDVNRDGNLTPADALLAFQHFLGIIALDECGQDHADALNPVDSSSDISPADALCILRRFLQVTSCLDPAELEIEAEDGLPALINEPQPLVARVTNVTGTPVAEEPVTFHTTGDSAILSPPVVLTDVTGKAATTLTVTDADRIEILAEVLGNNQTAPPEQELLIPLVA